jgi:hypothetical protein
VRYVALQTSLRQEKKEKPRGTPLFAKPRKVLLLCRRPADCLCNVEFMPVGVGWRPTNGQAKCERLNFAIFLFRVQCCHGAAQHAARDVLIRNAAAFGTFFEGAGNLFECTTCL